MSAFLDAAVTAVSQVLSGSMPARRVYPVGSVPKKPKGSDAGYYPYSVVGVTSDAAGNYTLDAHHGTRNYRIWVQSFGKTAESALAYDAVADANLLDQSLDVDGFDCGPIRVQVGGSMTRDPDDEGVVGVTSAYIFTTTKEA